MDQFSPEPAKYPVHMDVELSSKCNLRCRFCHLSYFTPKEIAQFTLDEFEQKIGPALPHLESITLFNKYEALTCREFLPIFNYISQFGIETYFSTNGLLLNDDFIDALVGKLTYLTVSVTGMTDASYIKNMGYDGLSTLRNNLAKLNARKAQNGTPYPILRISTVGMLDMLEELELVVDFAAEFDAREGVQLTSFKAHGKELVDLMPLNDIEYYTRETERVIAYARDKGVKFVLQSGSIEDNEIQTRSLGHRYCDMPWHRLSVQPNGDVYPCPLANEPIGNVRKEALQDIWTGRSLEAFRAGVNDPDDMNPDCANCTHCRHRSLTRREANDFSDAQYYSTGLTRIA